MKKILRYSCVIIIATFFLSFCGGKAMAQDDQPASGSITYQTFYDELSPFGTWIDYPGYGHVWSPQTDGDFRPYATNGYWVYSDEGWAWTSNYSWGWAPFHYGRWMYDDSYGWLWVPGYDWSPAWVTWGTADNYYAWAPLMPEVNAGVQFSSWRPHSFYWNICEQGHIYDRDLSNSLLTQQQAGNITGHIAIINNFTNTRVHNLFYAKGPAVNDVEKFTNHKIDPVSVKEVNNISQVKHEGNEMKVYRPQVQQPQPRQFRRVDDNNRKPLQAAGDKPVMQRSQQIENINHLSMHTAPAATFGGGAKASGGNRGGNRRN
jgi:hypothetical protein